MHSKVSPTLPPHLTHLPEWKSNIEKWIDYNWEKRYGATEKAQTHNRFELLLTSPENATQPTTTDTTDQDVEPIWMRSDFPKGPWDDDPDFYKKPYLLTKRDGIDHEWKWCDFPPSLDSLDALWAYVFDFDRDAFSVNSFVHFRLSNMPRRFVRYLDDDDDRPALVWPPKNLDDEYLAWNAIRKQPDIVPDLLQVYVASQINIVDAPKISNDPRHLVLMHLQPNLRKLFNCGEEFRSMWEGWTPRDRQMQRLSWTIVRYAIWDGLTFVSNPIHVDENESDYWDELDELPQAIPMPTEPEYSVLLGTNKILISLATDLDVDDVLKMAVAKVINLTIQGTTQVACIISLDHVVIVTVDKLSSRVIVSHTEPLALYKANFAGLKALIATLSPTKPNPVWDFSNNGVLPVEIVEIIFKFLVLSGGVETIGNFARACVLFSRIVRHHTVKIGSYLLLNVATTCAGVFYGLDEKGSMELFAPNSVEDRNLRKGVKDVMVLADGVNIGFSEYNLVCVKDCALTGSDATWKDSQ